MTDLAIHYTIAPVLAERVLMAYPGRQASFSQPNASEITTISFTPDFTGGDLTAVEEMLSSLKADAPIDIVRVRAVRAEVAALRNYLTVGSPTAAQTATATKAIIRVLRALIAD